MSDLADTIDDLICSFEGDGKTMDALIMYLFCWALVGFVALAVGKYAYARTVGYAARKSEKSSATAELEVSANGDRKQQQQQQQQSTQPPHRAVPPTPPAGRKRLGSKTAGRTSAAVAGIAAGLSAVPAAAAANKAYSSEQQQVHHHRPPPVATGNDPGAVRWANSVFKWLYDAAAGREPAVVEYLLGEWTATLNDYTKKSFAEVSYHPPLSFFLLTIVETFVQNFENVLF